MGWVKTVSGTKIVYTAPVSAFPLVTVVYDTKAKSNPWTLIYAWLNTVDHSTRTDIETLMGL